MMLMLTLVSGFHAAPAFAAGGADGCATAVVGDSEPGHAAGDADEVPADGDKATPHHHNVGHSHEIALPAADVVVLNYTPTPLPAGIAATAPPAAAYLYRDLRPPIA